MSARFRISLATLLWMTVALAIGLAAGLSPWVTRTLLVAVAPFLNPVWLILLTIAFSVAAPAFQLWLVTRRTELSSVGHTFMLIHGLFVFGYWCMAVLLLSPLASRTLAIIGSAVLVLFWSTVATAILWSAVAAVHARLTPTLWVTGAVVALEYAGMAIAVAMIHAVFLL